MGRSLMFGLALIVILISICGLIWVVRAIMEDENGDLQDSPTQQQVEEGDLSPSPTLALTLDLATSAPAAAATVALASPVAPAGGQGGVNTGQSAPTVAVAAPLPNCQVRTDWQLYTVQPGDTFAIIAAAVGLTIDELNAGNCLANIDNILVGQQLRVPTLPSGAATVPVIVATLPDAGQGGAAATGITTIVIAPSLGFADNLYALDGGSAVTISWLDVPATAISVSFFYQDVDDVIPALITEDNDLLDGATIAWTVPEDANGSVSAVATLQNGTEIRSELVSVVAQ